MLKSNYSMTTIKLFDNKVKLFNEVLKIEKVEPVPMINEMANLNLQILFDFKFFCSTSNYFFLIFYLKQMFQIKSQKIANYLEYSFQIKLKSDPCLINTF